MATQFEIDMTKGDQRGHAGNWGQTPVFLGTFSSLWETR